MYKPLSLKRLLKIEKDLAKNNFVFFFIFIHSLVSFWRVHKGLRHMLW